MQGFDVGDVPDDIDIWDMPIRPLDILSDSETLKELENYAKLALDKYNKDNVCLCPCSLYRSFIYSSFLVLCLTSSLTVL